MTAHVDARDALASRAGEENFPVALRILPRDIRKQLLAIYAFARLADDLGDEAAGDRLAQLDELDADLDRAVAGGAHNPVLQELTPVLSSLDVGVDPFRALIEANRMDQRVHRYETYDELRGYCMLSAAPVGRIVLSVFRVSSPDRIRLSDEVCIGLQLTEHIQDIGEDAARGRVYLPGEDLARFGCTDEDLGARSASTRLRSLVRMEALRARELLGSGVPLATTLPLQARLAILGFAAGGLAALDAVGRADGDALRHPCKPTRAGVLRHALAGLLATSRTRAASS